MPGVLIIRTGAFTPDQVANARAQGIHPAVCTLSVSWASYTTQSGNAAKARQIHACVNAQAAEHGFPVEAHSVPNVIGFVAGKGLIPAELQDGAAGFYVSWLAAIHDVDERTAAYPNEASLPYDVEAFDANGRRVAAGAVTDRAAAKALFGVLAKGYGAHTLEMGGVDRNGKKRIVETFKGKE